jgi:nucleotide-binding universal stress UspA family protein
VAPDIGVSSLLVAGATVPQLLCQGRGAQLLVLGGARAPFPRGLRGRLVRPVSEAVASRATCPVVVVRPLPSRPLDGARPRVVVGPGTSCAAALDVACSAARQRGLPVTVVGGYPGALQPWQTCFPDVRVDTCSATPDPASAMVRESAGAALVVVGSPGRGRILARPDPVGRAVSRAARCPVVVVHPDATTQDRHAEPGRRHPVPRRRAPWE